MVEIYSNLFRYNINHRFHLDILGWLKSIFTNFRSQHEEIHIFCHKFYVIYKSRINWKNYVKPRRLFYFDRLITFRFGQIKIRWMVKIYSNLSDTILTIDFILIILDGWDQFLRIFVLNMKRYIYFVTNYRNIKITTNNWKTAH